jgi:tetratricopeptide (TPR) repeat protein
MMSKITQILICLGIVCGSVLAANDPNQPDRSAARNAELLRRQVELQRVSAIEPNQPTQAETLKQVVNQLGSLEWSQDLAGASKPKVVGNLQQQEIKTAGASQVFDKIAAKKPVNEEKSLKTDLDDVKNPVNALAAADVLYKAKDYSRALRFYQIAAESKEPSNSVDRQWAVYQAANCLRHQDSQKAITTYQQVLAEYPDSPWAPAALIQQKNLEWFKQKETVLSNTRTHNDPNQP